MSITRLNDEAKRTTGKHGRDQEKKGRPLKRPRATTIARREKKASDSVKALAHYREQDLVKFLQPKRDRGEFTSTLMQEVDKEFHDVEHETREYYKKLFFGGMTILINELIKISYHAHYEKPYVCTIVELESLSSALENYYQFCLICCGNSGNADLARRYTNQGIIERYSTICPIPKDIAEQLDLWNELHKKLLDTSLNPAHWFNITIRSGTIKLAFKPNERMKDICDVPPLVAPGDPSPEEKAIAAVNPSDKFIATALLNAASPEERDYMMRALGRHIQNMLNSHLRFETRVNAMLSEAAVSFYIPDGTDSPTLPVFLAQIRTTDKYDHYQWNIPAVRRILKLISAHKEDPEVIGSLATRVIQPLVNNLNQPGHLPLRTFARVLGESEFFYRFRSLHLPFFRLFMHSDTIEKDAFNITEDTACPTYYLAEANEWEILTTLIENDMVEKNSLHFACTPGSDTAFDLMVKADQKGLLTLAWDNWLVSPRNLSYNSGCRVILTKASQELGDENDLASAAAIKGLTKCYEMIAPPDATPFSPLSPVATEAYPTATSPTATAAYAIAPDTSWLPAYYVAAPYPASADVYVAAAAAATATAQTYAAAGADAPVATTAYPATKSYATESYDAVAYYVAAHATASSPVATPYPYGYTTADPLAAHAYASDTHDTPVATVPHPPATRPESAYTAARKKLSLFSPSQRSSAAAAPAPTAAAPTTVARAFFADDVSAMQQNYSRLYRHRPADTSDDDPAPEAALCVRLDR